MQAGEPSMKPQKSLVFLALVIGTVMADQNGNKSGSNYELDVERLRRVLFQERNYDATSRPTNDTSEPTIINLDFSFKSITHVRSESDWFTGVFWLCASWHDHRLTWNQEEFDNRTFLHLLGREIWSPNLDVINAMGHDFDYWRHLLTIQSDGTAWFCFSAKFKMPCPANSATFLTGEQVCTILVVTLDTHESSEVALVEGKEVWEEFQEDEKTEWIITNISYTNYTEYKRPSLGVSFHLRKSLKRHRYSVTVPLVAVTLAMLAAFWMPPVSERRLTLVALNILVVALMLERMTTFLGLFVATSNILLFLGISTMAQVVTATGNIFVLNQLSSSSGFKVPDFLYRTLSGKAATILCLCDQEPETSTRPEDPLRPLAFDDSRDRRRRWLLVAQAVDRLFFIVLGLTAIGILA
ncbi:ligand-gated ion channel 4 [Rhipicephalus sanguineus]|uniref:ligand-gated ion channel 4 n=1 Tax=Rhipicephalus sanguineus TaxID=34632 RepID=UPI0018931552|nr:ligand-gated ion channel 4 [Rhipicephalus sanguineus]